MELPETNERDTNTRPDGDTDVPRAQPSEQPSSAERSTSAERSDPDRNERNRRQDVTIRFDGGADAPRAQPSEQLAFENRPTAAEPSGVDRNERNRQPRFLTAEQIGADVPEELRWVVDALVARFCITEITAKAKAGKTTFVLAMVRCLLGGEDFIGFRCQRSRVVYLTEERLLTFRTALARAGLLEQPNLHVLTFAETDGMSWGDVVDAAHQKCREVGAHILVVDTLAQFVSGEGLSETNPKGAFRAVAPLTKVADAGLAVVVVRHERKSGGTVGDAGRGSSAFTGLVDVTLSLKRVPGQPRSDVRELTSLSRFDETPQLLFVRRTDDRFVVDEDATAARDGGLPDAIRLHLKEAGESQTLDEICAAVGRGYFAVRNVLDELLSEGEIVREGAGRKGNPFRYGVVDVNEEPDAPVH